MSNTLGFGLRFALFFALLMTAFEASRGTAVERFLVDDLILEPTVHVINVVTPGERVMLVNRTMISAQGSRLHVTRGCEGIEMFLLLISAIAAFPASLRRRLRGFLVGFALAYVLSVGRLIALHYVLRYWPEAWENAHGLILPLAPIILMALFFLRWSSPGNAAALSRNHHAA
jgi:exosortase family protein XrtM